MTRERSTEEFLSAVRRMMRAAAKRVADGDEFELNEFMVMLRDEGKYVLGQAVAGQRRFGGKSWKAIGEGAGVTAQTAHERWSGVEWELWDIEWIEHADGDDVTAAS